MMRAKSFSWSIGIVVGLLLIGASQNWAQPQRERKVQPIITHAFAVERGHYGYVWKIYIEAEDPDGDMLRIASVVDQTGYGHYPTDWIYLKPQYKSYLKGYIQWNTFSSKTSGLTEWTQITLRVSVFDRAGNESNVVIFPFTFETGTAFDSPPAPFDQEDLPRLGYVHIDLYDPTRMAGSDGRD